MGISQIRAITNTEFVQMMGKCQPPTGWPSTIAVASSAGPDSTCLLFLLRRMVEWQRKNNALAERDLPNTILSLHVNHDLQSDAKKMAHAAGTAATRFKAVHSELRIPWGEPPFPPRRPQMGGAADAVDGGVGVGVGTAAGSGTGESTAIESVARTARYRLLFDEMLRRRVHVLATGHHADDQIETVLMRLGSGSSALGLGGMRPVRRFGMAMGKNESDYGWFGHEGLDRWIVRPLLDVPKDRILATCELHKIRYVIDRTNFQPDLTLRNAIRHMLANNEKNRGSAVVPVEPSPPLPPVMAEQITRMKSPSDNLKIPIPIDWMDSRENLLAAVHASSRNLSDIESKVSAYLSRFSVRSPPGTFILAADKLHTVPMDQLVQHTMVFRILRYISPHPWGSTRAQAGRRRERLQRIVQHVWDPDPASETRTRFEAGGNVLWTPLRICRDGRLRYEQPKWGERFGWLASRAPLPRHSKQDIARDISTELLLPGRRRAEILYDNRFLIMFWLEAVPPDDPVMASVLEGSGRVMLVLGGRWLWPQVVWRRKDEDDVMLARISTPELDWYEPPPGMRKIYTTRLPSEVTREPPLWQDIVGFKFIRVLEEP